MKCDICVCTYDNSACKTCPTYATALAELARTMEEREGLQEWKYGELYLVK